MSRKKFLLYIFIIASSFSFSQTYEDVLRYNSFSHEGTSRFNSMGGAFGALGGDVSAISINPASSSVFLDSEIAISLNYIAELYVIKGTYAEIEPLYKRALEINEKALGSDNPDVAISLNNLAELYYNQGRYKEAEPLYRQALNILKQTLGSDHPEVAITLENMRALYKKMGKDEWTE